MKNLVIALAVLFATPAFAQGNLAQTGFRCTPGVTAPASFAVGACNGGVGPCIGLWCPSTGVYANTLLWRASDGTDTPAVVPSLAAQSGKVLSNDGTSLQWVAGGGGSGTVTSVTCTGGLGGGTFTTTGTCTINLGTSNVWTVGQTMALLNLTNLTNQMAIGGGGKITTLSFTQPAASFTLTFPDAGGADTAAYLALAQTFSGIKTFSAAPVFAAGLAASGAVANDFSASTGAFKTSTGNNTIGGTGAGTMQINCGTAAGCTMTSQAVDSSTAKALIIQPSTAWATTTDRLLSIQSSAGVEQLGVNFRGDLTTANALTGGSVTSTTAVIANQGLKNGGSGAITQPGGTLQINFSTNGFETATTLTGNVTSVTLHSSATASGRLGAYTVQTFIQDATGSRTVTGWDTSFKWLPATYLSTTPGSAPTLSTGAGKRDTFVFVSDGTNWVEVSRQLNN